MENPYNKETEPASWKWFDEKSKNNQFNGTSDIAKQDTENSHIQNVINTCKRLNCSMSDLLKMDYEKELQITKSLITNP
jgi:hypothetical protein